MRKIKPFREWSEDAIWITFGISLTIIMVIVVWVTLPP